MIKEAISSLIEGRSLSFEGASGVMNEIMIGAASPAQIGAFLTALRLKGETVNEIAGLASVMREKATPVRVMGTAIDIVGTGGDGSGTFNISTAAGFVAAGAGLKVAKHGNRAMSSQCGSADILEALGVRIELSARAVTECIKVAGIGFMFAPAFHPAMKHAAGPRRELGIRTVFNILGPLTNPARVDRMVLGVPSEELGDKIAAVLQRLGTKHSLVVYGRQGIDEISISGPSLVWEVTANEVLPRREVSPADFGFEAASIEDVKGSTAENNARALRRILDGGRGPLRDVVVMNAAAAMVAADRAPDFKAGVALAEESIDQGRAREKLDALIRLSQKLK